MSIKTHHNSSIDKRTILERLPARELRSELERRAERREVTKEILKLVAGTSALTVGMLLAPQATATICKMVYDSRNKARFSHDKGQINQAIKRLRKQKIIKISKNKKGEIIIRLDEKGRIKMLRYQLNEMTIDVPKKWDNRWRLVVFDIPEIKRTARNIMTGMLKRLGFAQLQKSVWLIPYHCKNEIDFIAANYKISEYLLYIETEYLENEVYYKNYFNL